MSDNIQSVTLAQVIGRVESNNDCSALRFEPSIWEKLSDTTTVAQEAIVRRIRKIHDCSEATARMIYSTSWGAYQIMGFNIYGPNLSCASTVNEYMNNKNGVQDNCFDLLIRTMKLYAYTPESLAASLSMRHHFGNIYNGNGASYNILLEAALRDFGFNIKD